MLQDLPPLRLDPDIGRFLCPKCSTIIELGRGRAGTAGRRRRCQAALEVAADLSALWLRAEEQLPAEDDASFVGVSVAEPRRALERSRDRSRFLEQALEQAKRAATEQTTTRTGLDDAE